MLKCKFNILHFDQMIHNFIKTIIVLIGFFLGTLSTFSADTSGGQLIGHWQYSEANQICNLTFCENGTYFGNIVENGATVWNYAGKWSLIVDELHYEYTESSVKQVPAGTKDLDKLVKITTNYFIVINARGQNHKYVRIK